LGSTLILAPVALIWGDAENVPRFTSRITASTSS